MRAGTKKPLWERRMCPPWNPGRQTRPLLLAATAASWTSERMGVKRAHQGDQNFLPSHTQHMHYRCKLYVMASFNIHLLLLIALAATAFPSYAVASVFL